MDADTTSDPVIALRERRCFAAIMPQESLPAEWPAVERGWRSAPEPLCPKHRVPLVRATAGSFAALLCPIGNAPEPIDEKEIVYLR